MSNEMKNYIDRFRQFINENDNDGYVTKFRKFIEGNVKYQQALKDVNGLISLISSNEDLKDSEIRQKIERGDDDILDKMWDLAGSAVLKNAINVITYYHERFKNENM